MVSKEQAITRIVEENKATYEKTGEQDIIRLNQAEYEKASACLPPPSPEPAK
jgi:hypothetical protein